MWYWWRIAKLNVTSSFHLQSSISIFEFATNTKMGQPQSPLFQIKGLFFERRSPLFGFANRITFRDKLCNQANVKKL